MRSDGYHEHLALSIGVLFVDTAAKPIDTEPDAPPARRYAIFCVAEEAQGLHALAESLRRLSGPWLEVEAYATWSTLRHRCEALAAGSIAVAAVFCAERVGGHDGAELLATLNEFPHLRDSAKVILPHSSAAQPSVGRVVDPAAVSATSPTDEHLRQSLRDALGDYVDADPMAAEALAELVDLKRLARAYAAAEHARRTMDAQLTALRRNFASSSDLSDQATEKAMIDGIDQALAHPPRRHFPAASILLVEDEPVEGIWIVLEGKVELTRRAKAREIVFHSRSVGRIVGLLALAQRRRAFFTCRAVTEVVVLFVGWEDLDRALRDEPVLSVYFVTVLVRSLTVRLRRIVELQMEVEDLNLELAAERDQLAAALRQLEQAQTRLIESEKMATLGQLAAGVAHELNNPITAIRRASDYIMEDMNGLMAELPQWGTIQPVLRSALESKPLPTQELRARGEALEAVTGSDALVRRLLRVGITTVAEYERWHANLPAGQREEQLELMERAHQLGTSLRNIRASSERVTAIVRSLRSYARTDPVPVDNVDVHEGLDDTLLLFGPSMREVEVVRHYGPIPRIECRVGEINQVWTNLISNALDAMSRRGKLTIETDSPGEEHIRVRITDSGPGIPPENINRIFDLNFTTKHGAAGFGLGMGLVICQEIVTRHSGAIHVESVPGRTTIIVVLPVRAPRLPGEA